MRPSACAFEPGSLRLHRLPSSAPPGTFSAVSLVSQPARRHCHDAGRCWPPPPSKASATSSSPDDAEECRATHPASPQVLLKPEADLEGLPDRRGRRSPGGHRHSCKQQSEFASSPQTCWRRRRMPAAFRSLSPGDSFSFSSWDCSRRSGGREPRFYAMDTRILLALLLWAWDLSRIPRPAQLNITRVWKQALGLAQKMEIAVEILLAAAHPHPARVNDRSPDAFRPQPP